MPSLKDLNCAIELSGSQQALREFGTIYGDGFVETFVSVPSKPQSFSIHLTSNKFIAPGVAIFVYVDGVYQCNRNRQDLKLRKPSDSRSLVDFRVRQKEERQKDGSMIAREWAFDKLNIASADDAPNICSPNILDNIGCIEVVVLRCAGTRNAKSASTMNFDGAGDFPDRQFGVDDSSSPSNERSMYDDRGPFFNSFGNGHGPPPPVPSYRSPYAETAFSLRDHQSEHGPSWAKSQPGWGERPPRTPYAPSMKDFVQSTAGEKVGGGRSPSAVSWGSGKKDHTVKPSWGTETEKITGWGKNSDNGWHNKTPKQNDKQGWYSTDDDQPGGWNEAHDNNKTQADDGGWNTKQIGWDNPPSSPKQELVDKMNDWAGLKSALTSAFANPPAPAPAPAPEHAWPTQSWSFPADNAVKPTLQQPTPTPFASAPVPPGPASEKGRLPTQRMSNKTLSRYRPNHNFPSRIHPKPTPNFTAQPHWQFPPAPSTSTPKNVLHASSSNDTYIAPAEPRLTISKSTSSKSGIEHAVRAGKATEYGHVVGRPEYLDRLEKPYAVFRFKYRSEGVLKGLGVLGEGDMKHDGDAEKEKAEKLKCVPQEELIAKMLALERKLKVKDNGEGTTGGGKERKPSKTHADKEKQKSKQRRSSEKTDAHGDGRVKDFTEQWVERHSRDPSVKAKSAAVKEVGWEGDKERKEKEVVGTWGQDANEGWGGGGMTW
ncbi:uncharacterized protein J4E78_004475 [Alternaria triticimaculans]|uniref:uncharacterized protein n=1 Tax=Alternaria triticimaculans TaxID=297637 RepID=UPI0020C34391|nr:uncharacterized protein J4E78_004475 [Alternaria triticimaculans]KAI4661686.1 hypothetical protein J4E78_004475 [Alternaria triticimaculans]